MNNKKFLVVVLLFLFILTAWSIKKPKILIIGDSISMGYTPYVKQILYDNAIVKHNPGNAQHTGNGFQNINEWLGNEEWDIIQFNWGLWDLCHRQPSEKGLGKKDKINGVPDYSIEEYRSNLDSLVSILKRNTDARLIFLTTTYVPKNEPGRFENDAIKYNEAAIEIMEKHSITVHDIYDQSKSIHEKYGSGSNDVHYTDKGYEKLGNVISDFLMTEIKSLNGR